MGGCMSKPPSAPTTAPPWSELPGEIAGLVFCRLPSHHDRRSFGAVCRAWHLAARQQSPLPPAMPYINLGRGVYQSVAGGKLHRFPKYRGYRAGASFGDWIFYYGGGRCFLRGPGGTSIVVPARRRKSRVDFPTARAWALLALPYTVLIGRGMDMKMMVCSSRLVVALFRHPAVGDFPPVSYLVLFRRALLQSRWIVSSFVVQPQLAYFYTDIAFHHGKVYALSCWQELFWHDSSMGDGDANSHLLPIVSHDIEAEPQTTTNCYLVESFDKERLFMVRLKRSNDPQRAMDLWVFEADFDTGRWLEVKDLRDQILFLGRNCSMAFPAGSSEHCGPCLGGGNRVFVLGTEWARSVGQPVLCKKDVPTYCVYDMTSGETSLISLKGSRYKESSMSGWFFPNT